MPDRRHEFLHRNPDPCGVAHPMPSGGLRDRERIAWTEVVEDHQGNSPRAVRPQGPVEAWCGFWLAMWGVGR